MQGHLTFGRDPACHVILSDGSQKQAYIKRLTSGWVLRDQGGEGAVPIMINDGRSVEKILRGGDRIRIGPMLFTFVQGIDPEPDSTPAPSTVPVAAGAAQPTPSAPAPAVPAAVATPPSGAAVDSGVTDVARDGLAFLARTGSSVTAPEEALSWVKSFLPGAGLIALVSSDVRGTDLEPHPIAALPESACATLPAPVVLKRVFDSREPYHSGPGQRDAAVFDILTASAVQASSLVCVPLMLREECLGVLHVEAKLDAPPFTALDLQKLVVAAGTFAVVLERRRTRAQLEGYESRMKMYSRYLDLNLVERLESAGRAAQTRGEIKKLTVLFTDIRNFTAMSEKMRPQDLIAVMNQYFESMVEAINRYEGTVNKFIGDSIMAFWGAPDPKAMDSLLAVKASILMQRNLFFMNQDRKAVGQAPLYMGVGLHTGNAVVGNIGSVERKEYSALGDTVNTASRIQSLTKNDLPIQEVNYRIFLSDETYQEVKSEVKAEPLPPQMVKGKTEALKLWSVMGVLSETWGEEERRTLHHPFDSLLRGLRTPSDASFEGRITSVARAGLQALALGVWVQGEEALITIDMGKAGRLEDLAVQVASVAPGPDGDPRVNVEFRFKALGPTLVRKLEDFVNWLAKKESAST